MKKRALPGKSFSLFSQFQERIFTRYFFVCFVLWFISFNTLLLAKESSPEISKLQKLRGKLNAIFLSQSPQNFFWGVKIVDLSSKKTLYSLNAEKNFLPASNLKLVVTAAAFEYLDPSFKYSFDAYLTSLPETGSLMYNGDMIVKSNGHPCISSHWLDENPALLFEHLADSLLSKGIVFINGDIIGNDREFEVSDLAMDFRSGDGDYVATWEFEDLLYAMASPASALSFNENMLDVEVFPAESVGKPPITEPSLKTSFFIILNQAMTGKETQEKTLRITRQVGTNNIIVSGLLPINAKSVSEPIAIEKPAQYFLTVLKETLHRKGVAISGQARRIEPNEHYSEQMLIPLATFYSPPMLDILTYINKESNNFAAEQVLRTLGKTVKQTASQDSGLKVLETYLESLNLGEHAYRIKDASGLSRHNLISPDAIVKVLAHIYQHPDFEDFLHTLSIAGVDGTLERRFQRSQLKGKIFGKTGYLSSVRTFSGYLETPSGKWIGFSLMAMNYTNKTRTIESFQDKALELLKNW